MVFQESRTRAIERAFTREHSPDSEAVFASQRLSPRFSSAAPFRQLSSTPFRLIPDAGTEKLAGVLLISGKTRQVPSRRVTVRGWEVALSIHPSLYLSLFPVPFFGSHYRTLLSPPSFSSCLRRRFNNFDPWFWFYLRKPLQLCLSLFLCRFLSLSFLFIICTYYLLYALFPNYYYFFYFTILE